MSEEEWSRSYSYIYSLLNEFPAYISIYNFFKENSNQFR